MQVAVM